MFKLNEWINPKYLNQKNQENINSNYLISKPYEHFFLDDFFLVEKLNKIILALKNENYYLEENDLYKFFRTQDFSNSKNNKIIYEFRSFLISKEFRELIEKLTSSNINENKITLHSLKFKKTNYLLCHDDVVQDRLFAIIINLTRKWVKGMGGEFEIFDSDENGNVSPKIIGSVEPKFNRFYLFKVQKISYHQVSEVIKDIDRLTIGGWYYK